MQEGRFSTEPALQISNRNNFKYHFLDKRKFDRKMELRTERLRLRDFESGDLNAFYRYQNDPRYLEHYPYSEVSQKKIQDLMRKFIAWSQEQPRYKFQLAATDLNTSAFMGTCLNS